MALCRKPALASGCVSTRAVWSLCLASAVVVGLMAAPPAGAVEAWTRWETTLTSTKSYVNPYADVTLAVTYTAPSGHQYHTYGFWDGGRTFKLRFMFPPDIGTWTWRTTSSDPTNAGLHAHSATVHVTAYTSGSNRLYQHGTVRVSANQRYLVHDDGTPFLWKGDTAWMAPIAASHAWGSSHPAAPPEWEDYLHTRQRQHFNVIQVNIIAGFSKLTVNRNKHAPFVGSGATLRWQPAFWQSLEQKIQYANTQGFVIFLTGVGSPWHGFPSTNLAHVQLFARNLAARLMGNFVIYAPTADEHVHAHADAAGTALVSSTPLHLITAHPEMTPASAATTFAARAYTDVAGVQTGMGWLRQPHRHSPDQWGTKRGPAFSGQLASHYAIEAPLALYQAASAHTRKPVLNVEGVFDLAALHDGTSRRASGPSSPRIPPGWCVARRISAYSRGPKASAMDAKACGIGAIRASLAFLARGGIFRPASTSRAPPTWRTCSPCSKACPGGRWNPHIT